jgi:Cu/Ag efflux pump CusA
VDELRKVLIGTPLGAQIPIEEVARISFSRGPAMIRDEDGALTGYLYIDLSSRNYGDRTARDVLQGTLAHYCRLSSLGKACVVGGRQRKAPPRRSCG